MVHGSVFNVRALKEAHRILEFNYIYKFYDPFRN